MSIESELAFAEELRELFQNERSRPITVNEAANRIHARDAAVRAEAKRGLVARIRELARCDVGSEYQDNMIFWVADRLEREIKALEGGGDG